MKKNFSIRLISNDEIQKVADWARLEGFAPGFDDISIYKTISNYNYSKSIR